MSETDLIGTELDGRYRLELLLGDGGMGRVYRALQLSLERAVAVKVLREEVADNAQMRQRFDREAKILSGLDHPGIVRVHDYGVHEGCPYLVMDLVDGQTLEAHLRSQGQRGPAEVRAVLNQLCEALSHAHAHGIVHRDLKPENIVLEEGGRVRILDFGIARMVIGDDAQSQPDLTSTGMMVGTPQYVAPEQATGKVIDARTDLYALGLIAYRMLAGRPPFQKQSAGEYLVAHVTETPPTLEALGVDTAGLSEIVRCLLEKEPDRRYASAAAVRQALEELGPLPETAAPGPGGTRQMFQPGSTPAARPEVAATVESQHRDVPLAAAPPPPPPEAAAPPAPAPPPTPRPPRGPFPQKGLVVGAGGLLLALGLTGLFLLGGPRASPAVDEGRALLAAGKIPAARAQLTAAIEAESDPAVVARLRATLGRTLVAAEAPGPALEQFGLAVRFETDALADEDLAALSSLLGLRGSTGAEAEAILLKLGDRAGDHLARLAGRTSETPLLRLRAAGLAERLGVEVDSVPALIAALESEACEERRWAIKRLGVLRDPRALEPLQAYVAGREGLLARFACGRAAAVTALEQIGAAAQ